MENYKNYYVYADAIRNRTNISIMVPDITVENIDDHIDGIYAIMLDFIETGYFHNLLVNISWGGDVHCDLFAVDYWLNLIMWKMLLKCDMVIQPKHIFFSVEMRKNDIKKYVDKFVLTRENKIRLGNEHLNNVICDGLWPIANVEKFAYYLANTINNEDFIALMNASPEFYDLMHRSYANDPIESVKDIGMENTYKAISIIKDSRKYLGYDHGLAASFKASEAVNPRQFKEATMNIGTKPDGTGGIYNYIIDSNFMNGGVNNPVSFMIDGNNARYAQILAKNNVGTSGDFARLVGLNNTDTYLIRDTNYECMSRNFVEFEVKTPEHLNRVKNRYYRFSPNGMEHLIDREDISLVGKKILLRSPMTCSCRKTGGICKRCYGDLYYTNLNINPGKMASEILTSMLTQILLSAKHLLETKVKAFKWNPEFNEFFYTDINEILLNEVEDDSILRKYTLLIDPESIVLVDDDEEEAISYDDENEDLEQDEETYNEYVTSFIIRSPDGIDMVFGTETQDALYISQELNKMIRSKKAYADGSMVAIKLSDLQDISLFYIKINNSEISKTMDAIINTINKSSVTSNLSMDEALQTLVDLTIEGGLDVDSVHLETILSNQLVDPKDILTRPNWNIPNVPYRLLTLNQSLTNNPSVIVSLLYQNLHKTLYSPLTYSKHAPSYFDLFFCEQPQLYMNADMLDEDPVIANPEKGLEMCVVVDKGE